MAISLGPATSNLVATLGTVAGSTPGAIQGSAPVLQGSSPVLQGSSPHLQGGGSAGSVQGASTVAPPAAPAGGSATGGMNQADYLAGITQEYGGTIGGAHTLVAQNEANLPVQTSLVDKQYGDQQNSINQNATDQDNTLETQRQGVTSQQGLSLAELADNIRGQHSGLMNQLGAVGAGSSSAGETGDYALARAQNTARANVQQQASSGVAQIDAEKQATNDLQKTQLASLDTWKQQQLNQIMTNYATIQTQLEQAIQTASGEEKARLATFGVSIQQAAGSALTDLDNRVKAAVSNITNNQIAAAPTITKAPAYSAPAPITVQQVSPFQVGTSGAGNTTAPGAPVALGTTKDNQNKPVV